MMDMTSDPTSLPETTLRDDQGGSDSHQVSNNVSVHNTWTDNGNPAPQHQVSSPEPTTMTTTTYTVPVTKGKLRYALKRMTKMFSFDSDEMDPALRKMHYRRGSILIKHLETKKAKGLATEKDMKFFDMVKNQFDANFMESRTIISLSVFQTGSNPMNDPFAVIHMPVEIQQGFRRKLFAIFSIQLLAVVGLIALFGYTPGIVEAFESAFCEWHYVFATFVVMVLALLWLYFVKYRFPLNFIVLGIYTVAQSLFFSAFDYLFETRASIFMFAFLLVVMSITTLFCTMITKRSLDDSMPSTLISYPVVLLIGFFLAFVGSLFVYFFYMTAAISTLQYSACLAAMLLLIMWFAYDASCMNERLSPDEYMQGMVFFYTDMVLFLLFLSIIFVACFACEGDCACYGTADIVPIGRGGMGDDEEGGDLGNLDEEGGGGEVLQEAIGEDVVSQ
jgi:hypothetical protein